jgi:hypothetical protein
MSTDLAGFARQCRTYGYDLPAVQRRAVQRSALGMKESIVAEIRHAVPDMGVKGFRGRRQVHIGAGYRIRQGAGGAYAVVSAKGPLQLIERDTKAHSIPKILATKGSSKRKRQSRLQRRHVLLIPGIGYRKVVHHPGTSGKHPFRHGVDAFKGQVPVIFAAETRKLMMQVFTG